MSNSPRILSVTFSSAPLPTGAATEATLAAMSAKLPSSLGIKTSALSFSITPSSDSLFAISAASLPLPTGAATEATLAAQSAKLPSSLGAKTGALSLSVVPNSDTAFPVSGNVASGVADAGNPVKIGAVYNSALPTLTNGQRGDLQNGTRGSLNVTLFQPDSPNALTTTSNNIDTVASSATTNKLAVISNNYYFNGSTFDRMRGDTAGLVTQIAITSSRWQYAAASGGIVSSTAGVTIAAAAGASVRNYLSSLEIDNATLGATTEFVVRDGASGTVIWRGFLDTAASRRQITFNPPLKGSANTLMEVAAITSVTGGIYVNAQGYTAI